MRYLHLRLGNGEQTLHPLVSVLTDSDRFRDAKMLDWAPAFDPPRASVLLYLDGDLAGFKDVLTETDVVLDYDVTSIGDGRGYAYVHSEPHPMEWRLFEITMGAGLIPVFPFEYHPDGTIGTRVVGPADRLQDAVDAMPDSVDTEIQRVGEYDLGRPPIPPSLPPRQLEALRAALELGYYEIPREGSRDDVADRLGCAPSTATEHLRKAERTVVRTYLNQPG